MRVAGGVNEMLKIPPVLTHITVRSDISHRIGSHKFERLCDPILMRLNKCIMCDFCASAVRIEPYKLYSWFSHEHLIACNKGAVRYDITCHQMCSVNWDIHFVWLHSHWTRIQVAHDPLFLMYLDWIAQCLTLVEYNPVEKVSGGSPLCNAGRLQSRRLPASHKCDSTLKVLAVLGFNMALILPVAISVGRSV